MLIINFKVISLNPQCIIKKPKGINTIVNKTNKIK